MSIGRISSFLDIYIERDLRDTRSLDESRCAGAVGTGLVQKLRIVRLPARPDYDALFSGDPVLGAPNASAGMDLDGQPLVMEEPLPMSSTSG